MGSLGAPELLIILLVVLVLFGGAKLPQLARSLGEAQREFRSGSSDDARGGGKGSTAEGSSALRAASAEHVSRSDALSSDEMPVAPLDGDAVGNTSVDGTASAELPEPGPGRASPPTSPPA